MTKRKKIGTVSFYVNRNELDKEPKRSIFSFNIWASVFTGERGDELGIIYFNVDEEKFASLVFNNVLEVVDDHRLIINDITWLYKYHVSERREYTPYYKIYIVDLAENMDSYIDKLKEKVGEKYVIFDFTKSFENASVEIYYEMI